MESESRQEHDRVEWPAETEPASGTESGARTPARSTGVREQTDSHSGAQGGLLKRVWHEFKEDDVTGQAAKVAYYAFLALPPALMVVFSLAGLFGGQQVADTMTQQLESAMPGSASELVDTFVNQVVHDSAPGALSIGLLLALWSASAVFVGLSDTLDKAYDVEESRGFVKRRLTAIGVMLVVVVLFLLASMALLAGPQIASGIGLSGAGETLWNLLQWPLAFAVIAGAFWIVYYVLPDRDQSGCKKTLLKASAIAAALWLVATALFRFYVTNFGSYSETYGIIGAVIVLLLWLYVTGLVILTGGEIASEMEEGARAA